MQHKGVMSALKKARPPLGAVSAVLFPNRIRTRVSALETNGDSPVLDASGCSTSSSR